MTADPVVVEARIAGLTAATVVVTVLLRAAGFVLAVTGAAAVVAAWRRGSACRFPGRLVHSNAFPESCG